MAQQDQPPGVWGSFERTTGGWYPYVEQAQIEAAFKRGERSVFLPTCFSATIHFATPYCYQSTPAVGSKPAGFRSVLRGTSGQRVMLHWWGDMMAYRLEEPPPAARTGHTLEVEITPMPVEAAQSVWQWCDLKGDDMPFAVEGNWHDYAPEHSEQIEAAWARRTAATP